MKFWEVEGTAIKSTEHDRDTEFLKLSHISRLTDETYCAGFPWREEHLSLQDNLEICQKCTRSLAHRLAKSPGLLQTYESILTEQLGRGFIELVMESVRRTTFLITQ